MSALAKIAAATGTGGGNYIRDGIYKYLIEKITFTKGYTGETFVVEFRVIEAQANGEMDEKGVPVVPNAVGSSCSLVCQLDKFDNAAGNAKACVAGATAGIGYAEADITEEMLLEVSGPTNPLRGLAVVNKTYRGVNKGKSNPLNRGKPLTLNKWSGIAQTLEDMTAQRAWLDANVARADITPKAPAAAPAVTAAAPLAPVTPAPIASAPLSVAPAGGGILANLAALGRK